MALALIPVDLGKSKVDETPYFDQYLFFVDGAEKSLKSALDLLYQFAKYSGLKPNIEKTKAIWIGSKCDINEIISDEYNLEWLKRDFTGLGIRLNAKLENVEEITLKTKFEL